MHTVVDMHASEACTAAALPPARLPDGSAVLEGKSVAGGFVVGDSRAKSFCESGGDCCPCGVCRRIDLPGDKLSVPPLHKHSCNTAGSAQSGYCLHWSSALSQVMNI